MGSKAYKRNDGPTGGTGSAPPPGAPHQVSQPLDAQTLRDQLAKAKVNERELKPLVFDKPLPTSALAPQNPQTVKAQSLPQPETAAGSDPIAPPVLPSTPPPSTSTGGEPSGTETSAPGSVSTSDQSSPPALALPSHQPAASLDDDPVTAEPARGKPRPILDQGKQITGGWGAGEGGQYFALDGSELREVIRSLMDRLNETLEKDLRFSIALTYPQVRARLIVQIDGASADAAINDVAFDLKDARLLTLEALVSDTNDTPADALRDEAGLSKPRKQFVQMGAGKTLADVIVGR